MGILCIVFLCDRGIGQEFVPLLWQTLNTKIKGTDRRAFWPTHRKVTCDSIKADMDLMHKVGGVAYTHEGTPLIDIILPSVDLLVVLERQPVFLVLGLQIQTVRLQICPLDI